MAIDIMNILMQYLCPTSNAMNACQSFVQASYHQVVPPLGPLFYFFLFPSVFLIVFIYILTQAFPGVGNNRGLRLLVAIAVFIFIIINGFYPLFLWLSDIWFIAIVIIGLIWFFIKGQLGKGGGKGGGMPSVGAGGSTGILSQIGRRVVKEAKGEIKRLEGEVDLKLKELENVRRAAEKDPAAWRGYPALSQAAWAVLNQYKNELQIGGIPIGGRLAEKAKKLEEIVKDMDSRYKK